MECERAASQGRPLSPCLRSAKRKHGDELPSECSSTSSTSDTERMPAPIDSPPQAQRFSFKGANPHNSMLRHHRIKQLMGGSPLKESLASPGGMSCASGALTPLVNEADDIAALQQHAQNLKLALNSADLTRRGPSHMATALDDEDDDGYRTPSPSARAMNSDILGRWEDSYTTGFQPPELCWAPERKRTATRFRTHPVNINPANTIRSASLVQLQAYLSGQLDDLERRDASTFA
jgi:hypothetical protein